MQQNANPCSLVGKNVTPELNDLVKKVIDGPNNPSSKEPISENVTAIEYGMIGVMMAGIIATAINLHETFAKVPDLPSDFELEIVNLHDKTTCSVLTSDTETLKKFITKAYHEAGINH